MPLEDIVRVVKDTAVLTLLESLFASMKVLVDDFEEELTKPEIETMEALTLLIEERADEYRESCENLRIKYEHNDDDTPGTKA